jgi:Protein of unknown function (DUF559)
MNEEHAATPVFGDEKNLDELTEALRHVGFAPPKWTYRPNVPIRELTCSKRKFLCDVVAYRHGVPVCVFELDGRHHVEEKQERLDEQKEKILRRHGLRVWRMWNGELFNIREDGGRLFRLHVKAHLYAKHGELACDWKTLCPCTEED